MTNIYQNIKKFDLQKHLKRLFKKADSPFGAALIGVFLALNIIFLYHSTHFLFGDHDWKYLKDGIRLSDGLFEGRFSQFILINMLTQGEILPILNNVIGFAGFALGIALLAKYWDLPHQKRTYLIFALFTALTPYILSFMYFAFLIIPVLSWNACIVGALLISEKETTFSGKKTLLAALLIVLALGGYPPVINLIGVALVTRWLIIYNSTATTLTKIIKNYRWSLINIIIALALYKLTLIYFTSTGAIDSSYYNLQTTPLAQWPTKALLVIKDAFLEFSITLPFITAPYKIITVIIALSSLITLIIKKQKISQRFITLVLWFATILAGLNTLFLSTSLKETEFSPRIDFFGFMYTISGMLAIILKSKNTGIKNLITVTAFISIILNTYTLFEAQKVWKLGFDAELSMYKRIAKRFQTDPLFNINNHYIVVQGGSPSFRQRFYHNPYQKESDDLLAISYVPGMASGVMWNYYAPHNYTDKTSYVYNFRPDAEIQNKLINAKPWPHAESIAVGGYWILLPLTPEGLADLRHHYLPH